MSLPTNINTLMEQSVLRVIDRLSGIADNELKEYSKYLDELIKNRDKLIKQNDTLIQANIELSKRVEELLTMYNNSEQSWRRLVENLLQGNRSGGVTINQT